MAVGTPWKNERPPEHAWRGQPGRTPAELAAEQDAAAGGRQARSVRLANGDTARGSVELKVLPRQRRIRAYLRWYKDRKSHATYVGEVSEETREANLKAAWQLVRDRGLLDDGMNSWASTPAVRNAMRANKARDTKPELALRSALHALGLRYRVGVRPDLDLRRTADVTFRKERIAVFVDGCFWHGCVEHYRPSTGGNSQFWADKVSSNRRRDAETTRHLEERGWTVIRVWEHEDAAAAARKVHSVVTRARAQA